MRDIATISTTTASEEAAADIARALVETGRAACAHVEPIRSIYRWDGKIVEDREWRVTAKTVPDGVAACEQLILDRHSYDLPAITAETVAASDAYARWVSDEVKGGPDSEF